VNAVLDTGALKAVAAAPRNVLENVPGTRQDVLLGRTSCSNEAMELSDEALVQQAVGLNDTQAFEQLVRRHQRRILLLQQRFCRDHALAEDLCQETFLRAWRKLASFDNRGRFGGWLAKLAYNVFLQNLRKNKQRTTHETAESPASEAVATTPAPATMLDLETLLAVVSEDEQVLLVLNYAHGLSNSEIAGVLDTPEGTIKSQIRRAKQKIREHFDLASATSQNQATGAKT
jgi:RNA polymerase sigma-70 factor (ECF subfamily)